ncbi:conserved hypothetical protein [Pediculus humanus corporis]|uniref:Uncharacterized protein n=1 Tax=Pediculus humanus subsp. corporis TaxID=121224 RepID=E0VSP4_PEDHC|nr:uncharacterized protein Phum_PHUM421360 [Pediculus humanus corporis]EEB16400.1 conserved hypothetical protein [Pediculus humanus corporis]
MSRAVEEVKVKVDVAEEVDSNLYNGRRLRNDVVEDIPKPTPMRKTFNELLKRDLTVPNLKSVKKFPKAKEDATESKVEKSQSILEKLRAAAKKKRRPIKACTCEHGKEITFVIKGVCLCDNKHLKNFETDKSCGEYCKSRISRMQTRSDHKGDMKVRDSIELYKTKKTESGTNVPDLSEKSLQKKVTFVDGPLEKNGSKDTIKKQKCFPINYDYDKDNPPTVKTSAPKNQQEKENKTGGDVTRKDGDGAGKSGEVTRKGGDGAGKSGEVTRKGGDGPGKSGEITRKGGDGAGKSGEITHVGGDRAGKSGEVARKGGDKADKSGGKAAGKGDDEAESKFIGYWINR